MVPPPQLSALLQLKSHNTLNNSKSPHTKQNYELLAIDGSQSKNKRSSLS